GDSVIHDCIATHSIRIARALASCLHSAIVGGSIPIHCDTGPGLEYGRITPCKEPGVIVRTKDAGGVVGQHGINQATGKQRPCVRSDIEDLAVLAAEPTTPRTTNRENAPVRQSLR